MAQPSQTSLDDLLELMRILNAANQEAPGWLESGLRNIHVRFGSPDVAQNQVQQDAAARIQADIDEFLAEGIMLVYYFAMFEEYLPTSDWDSHLEPDVAERLRAYRHVRHTVAHGTNRVRSTNKTDRAAFDKVMNSANPLSGIAYDATHITEIRGALRSDFVGLLDTAAKQAVQKTATT